MPATGSPGMSRGKIKFNINAQINVTMNQANLVPKYLAYPFNASPL
jgi:hypothetical protein